MVEYRVWLRVYSTKEKIMFDRRRFGMWAQIIVAVALVLVGAK